MWYGVLQETSYTVNSLNCLIGTCTMKMTSTKRTKPHCMCTLCMIPCKSTIIQYCTYKIGTLDRWLTSVAAFWYCFIISCCFNTIYVHLYGIVDCYSKNIVQCTWKIINTYRTYKHLSHEKSRGTPFIPTQKRWYHLPHVSQATHFG